MMPGAFPARLEDRHIVQIAAIESVLFHRPLDQTALQQLVAGAAFRGFVMLAQDEATVLAHALFLNAGEDADLVSVATAPSVQRQGIAAQLLHHAFGALASESVQRIVLEVAVNNLAAIHLYRAQGFSEVGRRARYYSRPGGSVDALIMARELAGAAA